MKRSRRLEQEKEQGVGARGGAGVKAAVSLVVAGAAAIVPGAGTLQSFS